MRKPAFCICKNKSADQLRGKRVADKGLCFRYIDSYPNPSNFLIPKFQALAFFCGCTAGFVSDLVGNSKDRFSHNGTIFRRFSLVGNYSVTNHH